MPLFKFATVDSIKRDFEAGIDTLDNIIDSNENKIKAVTTTLTDFQFDQAQAKALRALIRTVTN